MLPILGLQYGNRVEIRVSYLDRKDLPAKNREVKFWLYKRLLQGLLNSNSQVNGHADHGVVAYMSGLVLLCPCDDIITIFKNILPTSSIIFHNVWIFCQSICCFY